MPDLIRFAQRVIGRLTTRRLFAFTPEFWDRDGLRPDPMRQRQLRLSQLLGVRMFSRAYPGIPGRVHVHDNVLMNDSPEELTHYAQVGQSAMDNIEATLAAAGKRFEDIGACLDMACGYGRVLRLLARRIPAGRITACDIEEEAVRFCAAEFGAQPLVSQLDLRKVQFPKKYDLIWVGSLFTHLPPAKGWDLLAILSGLLNPGGLMIFSTQGESCLSHVPMYGFMFKDKEQDYRDQVARQGWGYHYYYAHSPYYGITFYAREHLEQTMAEKLNGTMKLVRYQERGWDNHQDIWAFQRA